MDIYADGAFLATVPATEYRPDVQAAGYGNGLHGFTYPVPPALANGVAHSIAIDYNGTTTPLPNSPKTITCTAPPATLTVTTAGTGTGTVTSSPAGINCGSTCSATFPTGTSVTLTATAAAGSAFSGWSGDAACASGTVVLSASHSCTATFNIVPTVSMTWISPEPVAGFGPAESLVVAGGASGAPSGTGVQMWWRDITAGGAWTLVSYAPAPSNGVWLNDIPNANYLDEYQVYAVYDGVTSTTCTYAGNDATTDCP